MFKPGDLVWVAKGTSCCGGKEGYGVTFTIEDMFFSDEHHCMLCGEVLRNVHIALTGRKVSLGFDEGFQTSRLRLIPPLSDLETTEREVEHAA